ncbi:unnamed protein product [Ostreobium quekettii]|uniref:Uncharacterized protein n=1 Tax=Ostreobium quekettii TaxID=121088 RepID=A0A8S1J5Z5_9CHLO|nr:unnamed protein product [Ostreobium quekettii]
MAELATLRTAKTALDEGLISKEDFEVVKAGFVKAQQIKAGLDAGFIKEEDLTQVKDTFFHSLDMQVPGCGQPGAGAGPTAAAARQAAQKRGIGSAAIGGAASRPAAGANSSAAAAPVAKAPAARAAPPPPPAAPAKPAPAPKANSLTESKGSATAGKVGCAGDGGRFAAPLGAPPEAGGTLGRGATCSGHWGGWWLG